MASKTPNGFRAVRMRGKTEVVYCVERVIESRPCRTINVVDTYTEKGSMLPFTLPSFNATHIREYSPMPDAVRAIFEGKPSFAAWWEQTVH